MHLISPCPFFGSLHCPILSGEGWVYKKTLKLVRRQNVWGETESGQWGRCPTLFLEAGLRFPLIRAHCAGPAQPQLPPGNLLQPRPSEQWQPLCFKARRASGREDSWETSAATASLQGWNTCRAAPLCVCRASQGRAAVRVYTGFRISLMKAWLIRTHFRGVKKWNTIKMKIMKLNNPQIF